jgi:hypothetical protein
MLRPGRGVTVKIRKSLRVRGYFRSILMGYRQIAAVHYESPAETMKIVTSYQCVIGHRQDSAGYTEPG